MSKSKAFYSNAAAARFWEATSGKKDSSSSLAMSCTTET
jgi:hypothetical protein